MIHQLVLLKSSKKRGVVDAELKPLLEETETFDTILLLMNGTGIFEEAYPGWKLSEAFKNAFKSRWTNINRLVRYKIHV